MVDLAQTRGELVDAVDQLPAVVDGVPVTLTGHLHQPHPVMAWDAWPVWQAVRPVAMCVAETDWQLCVALPAADPATTVAAGDALIDPVALALEEYQITTVAPGQLVVADGATVPILIFAVTI